MLMARGEEMGPEFVSVAIALMEIFGDDSSLRIQLDSPTHWDVSTWNHETRMNVRVSSSERALVILIALKPV